MHDPDLKRRRFLVAVATFGGTSLALGPSLLLSANAWANARTDASLTDDSHADLVRIARLLYPHKTLSDQVYAEVLDEAMGMVAEEPGFRQLLADARQALDTSHGSNFLQASPESQLAALQAIEGHAYFGTILGAVSNRLYSHTGSWEMLGYPGPSFEQGGYIDRGSGDIDWLPEGDS